MRILITNDDGIYAPGIARLAEHAGRFGDVYVAAPEHECSAMSHRITLSTEITITEISDFPVPVTKAFQVGGTPADCVKVAVEYLLGERPDVVLSGVNNGYNAGLDIAYSGTVAAAMEAVMKGLPAIAFSAAYNTDYKLVDKMLPQIIKELLHTPAEQGKIWNVNFPECTAETCQGILRERTLARTALYPDVYGVAKETENSKTLLLQNTRCEEFDPDTDLYALLHGYISIGTITNMILGQ